MTHRRRTKWHRRGRAVAEVLVGVFAVLATAVFQFLVSLIGGSVIRIVRRTPKKAAADTKRSVSVGSRDGTEANRQRLFNPATVPIVRFDSVAGLAAAKEEILVRTVYPLR